LSGTVVGTVVETVAGTFAGTVVGMVAGTSAVTVAVTVAGTVAAGCHLHGPTKQKRGEGEIENRERLRFEDVAGGPPQAVAAQVEFESRTWKQLIVF